MHTEVEDFIRYAEGLYPQHFRAAKVLEAGSLDVNGSIRKYFWDAVQYMGLDLDEGPGVDVVLPVHLLNAPAHFDVVVSTEMLEHDRYWRESLSCMYQDLRPGGLLIITCAGPDRPEHGTVRTSPADSPFTNDYYRNLSQEDFTGTLPAELFASYHLRYMRGRQDLAFCGIKVGHGG